NAPVAEIIKRLFVKGTAVTVNQILGVKLATDLANEMGYTVTVQEAVRKQVDEKAKEDLSHLPLRPPIVTIMGHVDHGKTTLLDTIRKTNVAEGEAGGITQHIGAYNIKADKGSITFLDTPGHEAFTAIRARGAQVTDIVVLVVAADDGIMPQTEEAINHAKAAGVTIIVAVNKIDVPDANPDKVKQELGKFGLVPEDWGGQTIICNVSAKTGEGLDNLLDMIYLQAEVMELHADPKGEANATVIESKLDKARGPILSVVVNNGTIKKGDSFVAGAQSGKVRAMINDSGQNINEAGPSIPVEILGASDICEAGDTLAVMENDRKARQISQQRQVDAREEKFTSRQHVRLENIVESLKDGEIQGLRLVVKADTQGSVDAVKELLSKLVFEEVKLHVIHSGVGGITETDIMLANASNAIVIGFNVRPTSKAKKLGEQEKIDMQLYNVIYEITDDIKNAVMGLMTAKIEEKTIGRAEIRNTFKVSKVGTIAGCMVLDGTVRRGVKARLTRDSVVVYTGSISSLRRFKEDVKEVQNGYECGIGLENYNDVKNGDVIEVYVEEEIPVSV
ncbi:MAG: translation initiation factor IF-2, partial [Nitrospinota bacterium]